VETEGTDKRSTGDCRPARFGRERAEYSQGVVGAARLCTHCLTKWISRVFEGKRAPRRDYDEGTAQLSRGVREEVGFEIYPARVMRTGSHGTTAKCCAEAIGFARALASTPRARPWAGEHRSTRGGAVSFGDAA